MLLNYFHEYAILLHPNFSVLTVDRASSLSVKSSGEEPGGRRKHHFREMRQPSAMSPDDRLIAAQLLGNGGKIEPYAIIIMDQLNNIRND
jgi:hypothetical protein